MRPKRKGKKGRYDPSYNDERAGNRPHFFMPPQGPGFYSYGQYAPDPYYYGGRGYGGRDPRGPERHEDRKGPPMYPEQRRGPDPYHRGRDPRGFQGNFEGNRPPMRDAPTGQPQSAQNRREGPNGPPREYREARQGGGQGMGPPPHMRGPPPGEGGHFDRPIRGGRGMRGGRGRGGERGGRGGERGGLRGGERGAWRGGAPRTIEAGGD